MKASTVGGAAFWIALALLASATIIFVFATPTLQEQILNKIFFPLFEWATPVLWGAAAGGVVGAGLQHTRTKPTLNQLTRDLEYVKGKV